jgi:uncharacterized membrane protein YkvA (DUF1232 family)
MERGGRTATALLVVVCVWVLTNLTVTAAVPPSGSAFVTPSGLMALSADDQPIQHWVGGITRSVLRQVRWFARGMLSALSDAADFWRHWLRRAAFSLAVVVIAALADTALVTAWRTEGLRALVTYSTLMLYVYGRLLFSSRVNIAPKLLLAGAVAYGIFRRDLVPDRSLVPGRVDDVVLIVVATRAFVYACPEALIREYADRAVRLKRRVLSFQRFRR